MKKLALLALLLASSFVMAQIVNPPTSSGSVSSVGETVNGGPSSGIFTVTGSPVTTSGTLDLGILGTSGGVPYFSSTSILSPSAALTLSRLVLGGGAGAAPTVLGSLGTTTTLLHGNAGGAPTFGAVTLTTDVTGILPPANGGVYNSGTTVGFGGFWAGIGIGFLPGGPAAGSGTIVPTSAGNLTGNNVIHWHSFDLYGTQVVGHISFEISTGVNPSTTDVGVYDKTGQTLLVNMGGVSTAAASGNITASVAQVTLAPGTYIWAWCGTSSGTITNLAYQALNLTSDGTLIAAGPLKNINGKRYGTSANACAAGVLPAALGALTAGNFSSVSLPPATWMEP